MIPRASAFQDPRLQTAVERLSYDYTTRTGRLHQPAGCCTDMSGVVALFRFLHPDVQKIETFAGGRPDTLYRLDGGAWTARRGKGGYTRRLRLNLQATPKARALPSLRHAIEDPRT